MAYRNVDIYITKSGDNYDVKVAGPAGMASSHFTIPFQQEELKKFIVEMGATRRPIRRDDTPQMRAVRSFGRSLYTALLTDESYARFKSALDQIHLQGDRACIRLHLLNTPELMNLPWEYLYDANGDTFWALSADTPIVRFVELAQPVLPLPTEPPLRILGMVSSPDGGLNLNLDTERRNMEEALAELRRRGQIGALEITWLQRATLEELQRTLRRQTFHIFHFLGHGTYDSIMDEGALVFEDENRRPSLINATKLGTLLRDHKTLRLAVLNACEGARTSEQDPFAGVAPAMVRTGLPVAIAMQFEVTDKAAIIFAREFYSAIADGLPVYAAVSEARKAIFFSGNDVEWGTPVIFSRVNDGIVFVVNTDCDRGVCNSKNYILFARNRPCHTERIGRLYL